MVKIPVLDRFEEMSRAKDAHRLAGTCLQQIRQLNVASFSDAGLRDTISEIAGDLDRGGRGDDVLPTVFAVVNEAISRRQGDWRFFDPTVVTLGIQPCHAMADRISHSPEYQRAANEWAAEGSSSWESFDRAVSLLLDRHAPGPSERILVTTLLFVRQRSQTASEASILLPAWFYETLRKMHLGHDEETTLVFRVSGEQLLAGILLYQGNIVEMNAGEGKTIAAAFPAVLHAVRGRAVHVMTANDYLAARDADLLAPVFESLGLSVGTVLEVMEESERHAAYGKDIVYGALREFGFDFMRDNLKLSSAEVVQRELDVAIIDEADHALIDEANIPLIIAGGSGTTPKIPAKLRTTIERLVELQGAAVSALEHELEGVPSRSKSSALLLAKIYLADPESTVLRREFTDDPGCSKRVMRVIAASRVDEEYDALTGGLYYWVDNDGKSLCLTEQGQDFVESRLGPLFDDEVLQERLSSVHGDDQLSLASRRKETDKLNRQLARAQDRMHQVVRMLWGYILLKKDLDYLVRDDQVVLIDKYTGRGRPDTRYHYGLQAAIEVKEGVPVQPEHEVLGRISARGFVSQYPRVSGMTGTAMSAKNEFRRAYGLDVVAVPPSNSIQRTDLEPRMYFSKADKFQAILEEVRFWHGMGRPVLIGTHSIEECDAVSQLLRRGGIEHNQLNAANDLEEDRIIKEAGLFGAVTVATDMAGRGTDIILESGSDRRTVACYVARAGQLLAEGVGVVTLRCPTEDAAGVLLSAIDASAMDCSVATARQAGGTDVVVSARGKNNGARTVSLEFGLGLYVIGAGNSETARIDHQLKGRSGRQGDFGASKFILSAEDGLLKFAGEAGPASSELAGMKTDSAGRAFREGESLTRHLGKLQKDAEKDAESRRAKIEEYTRVFEAQSFAYYRARKDILGMEDYQPFLQGLVAAKAGELAQMYFPKMLVDDYERQLKGLSEELELDYKVSAADLEGLDLNLLQDEIACLIMARLDRTRERFTGEEFGKLAVLLYLQTSDELWRDHMSQAQSLVLCTQLCSAGGRGDLAAYTLTSFESYEYFQTRIVDLFLPKLAAFPSMMTRGPQPLQLEIFDEVIQILA